MCFEVTQSCLPWCNGRTLLDKALSIWRRYSEIYQMEIARSTFVKGRVLEEIAGVGDDAARALIREASRIRDGITGLTTDDYGSLLERDFNVFLWYWSR